MDKTALPLKDFSKILILFVLVLIFIFLWYNISRAYINKTSFENDIIEVANKNEEKIFEIDNVTLFSSANSEAEIKSNSTLAIKNLYQYTDIALFIKPLSDDLTYKNTLKEVYINNVKFVTSPTDGIPNLYYKNLDDFAKPLNLAENKIENGLYFNITSENQADLTTPTLYNNCANPITISYINKDIKTNYSLSDTFNQVAYDGSLLKKCNVLLSSISCSLSFDIHITNNLDHQFICPIYIDIPLDSEDGTSIYDGKVQIKKDTNYTFYRCN